MIAFAYTGQELASGVKVSIEQARAAALNAVPGTITDQELEKEGGGPPGSARRLVSAASCWVKLHAHDSRNQVRGPQTVHWIGQWKRRN
jgi:hypothetical protein